MLCPLCDRPEVEGPPGVFTCDCPMFGYEAPQKTIEGGPMPNKERVSWVRLFMCLVGLHEWSAWREVHPPYRFCIHCLVKKKP